MKVEIPTFEQASVLVVGDIMLDQYWYGPTQRISPEAPVPVVKINQEEHRPGGAANVALNIASSIGGRVTLAGITGEDNAAQHLTKQLSALNINCEFDQQKNIPTITKLRVMSRNQQLIRLDFEESLSEVNKKPLEEKVAAQLENHDLLLLSDYSKGTLSDVQNLIALAKNQGKAVLVDPKGTDFERYRGATLLTPNLSEFEAVVGECKTENDIVTKGQDLLVQLDLEAMLVTRSEQGMTLLRRDHEEFHLPTRAREVYGLIVVYFSYDLGWMGILLFLSLLILIIIQLISICFKDLQIYNKFLAVSSLITFFISPREVSSPKSFLFSLPQLRSLIFITWRGPND